MIEIGDAAGVFQVENPSECAQKCRVLIDGLLMQRSAKINDPQPLLEMAQQFLESDLGVPCGALRGDHLN